MNNLFEPPVAPSSDNLALVDPARAVRLLSQFSRAVTRIREEKALLAEICRVAVDAGGYCMAWVGCTSAQSQRLSPAAFIDHFGQAGHASHSSQEEESVANFLAHFLTDFHARWDASPASAPGPVAAALRSGTAQCCLDLQAAAAEQASAAGLDQQNPALDQPYAAELQRGYRSLLALPLQHGAELLGVCVLYGPAPLAAVPHAEIALLQEMADNLAFSLGARRARRAQARLEKDIFHAVPLRWDSTKQPHFQHMVSQLAEALGCEGAVLTRALPDAPGRACVLAGHSKSQQGQQDQQDQQGQQDQATPALEFDIADSPCRQLLNETTAMQIGPLTALYPHALLMPESLRGHDSATFLGHRLEGSSGQLLGMLCVVFKEPPPQLDVMRSALQIFAMRAAARMERMDADEEIRRLNASLEERVERRTAQLKLANEELESFCYSVSHDLRTPLSAVDGFATLLEQALARSDEPQSERQRHYLRRIRAGMVQMGELIDALLMLARLARVPLTLVPVDLSQMAREILAVYAEREPARALQAEIEPGLTAHGDVRLIRQLLENLLGNAWKFSSGQALTQIRFARGGVREDAPEQPVFVVEDKGAGFNMAYAQKLFGPFQRLHSPSEFEGTGIGLATVQRIVHRHGGRVWGESEVGQGARFYFSLGPA